MTIIVHTHRAMWKAAAVPNWRCWMWAVRAGRRETFWRIGPLYVQRFAAESPEE